MDQEWLSEDETLEDLQLHGLKLLQKKEGFNRTGGLGWILLFWYHIAAMKNNTSGNYSPKQGRW